MVVTTMRVVRLLNTGAVSAMHQRAINLFV